MTALTVRLVTAAGVMALASACTMKDQEAPPLTGPSEFSQSITISASPDVLPQDGASQSFITVTALDPNAQPIRNLTLRTEIRVGGTPVDFGVLSTRSVVTGSDGKATLVYTAPPSPSVSPDNFIFVDIVVTPFGTNADNSSQRLASIRLVPQGPVIQPFNLVPAFTVTPTQPVDNQTVLFDASGSTGSIAQYEWNFGDGRGGSGRTASHSYDAPGTYIATLTLVDGSGRSASLSRSITVAVSTTVPTSVFVFSPSAPRAGQVVNFNAAQSRPPAGGSIVSYTWNFGDGSPRVTTGDPAITKAFASPGTYQVSLTVTDNAGRTAVSVVPVPILP
jgi:PKD repeat protein